MILCINSYEVKPGKLEKLVEELRLSRMEEHLRKADGNRYFCFSVPIGQSDALCLTDAWEDEASFQAHLQNPYIVHWERLKEKYVVSSRVRRYDL